MVVTATGCDKKDKRTFAEACNDFKQQILTDDEYLCEFSMTEVYGRESFFIKIFINYDSSQYESAVSNVIASKFETKYHDYMEENFSRFTNECIFLFVTYNGTLYVSDIIYGYGADN